MNLRWNHILLACLLTVLEIYGTEAILSIPYGTRLIEDGNRSISSTVMPPALAKCYGGSHVLVHIDSSSKTPAISFKEPKKMPLNVKVLFYVVRDEKNVCSFYYPNRELLVERKSYNPHYGEEEHRIIIKSLKKSKTGAEVQFVLQMDEVSEVMNGITTNIPLGIGSIGSGDNWVLRLPQMIGFSMDYKVGTFPTKAGCCGNVFNRMWNFTPNGHMQSVALSCGPSSPVKVYCTDDRCTNIGYSTDVENSKNVMAYIVIDRNEKVRLVKGNKKKVPKDTFCTLYARNDDEVQFPLFGKNHINVAHVVDNVGQIDDASDFDDSPKIRSGRGFRLYTKSLKIESI